MNQPKQINSTRANGAGLPSLKRGLVVALPNVKSTLASWIEVPRTLPSSPGIAQLRFDDWRRSGQERRRSEERCRLPYAEESRRSCVQRAQKKHIIKREEG